MQIVIGDIRTKGRARELAVLELIDRLAQRAGDTRQVARSVDIALEDIWRLDFVGDPIQPGRYRRSVGNIRVGIRAWQPALDSQRRAVADHAKAGGAIIVAP